MSGTGRRAGEAWDRLDVSERLAIAGVAAGLASLFLPWFGVRIGSGLVVTGWGSFGPLEAAYLLTLGGVGWLVLLRSRGRAGSIPFREGTLIAASGAWAAVVVGVRIATRPEATTGGLANAYGLRYGVFVALGAAALILVAGVERRRRAPGDRTSG